MSRLKIIRLSLWIALVLAALPGCRRQTDLTAAPGYEIELIVVPSPPAVGHAHLELKLTDPQGQPLQGADLSIRGDMTHPGMTPVLAEVTELGGGRYTAAIEWSMAGDWVVTIEVELRDGLVFERTFNLSVSGSDVIDHDS